ANRGSKKRQGGALAMLDIVKSSPICNGNGTGEINGRGKRFSPGESTPTVTPFLSVPRMSDRERERVDRIDRLENEFFQYVKAYMRPKARGKSLVRSMARIATELSNLYV